MSGACFANVSDFFLLEDLAAFVRRCQAHVLQMFLIFPALEGPGGICSAMSGACFANVSDFSTARTWRHAFGDVRRVFKCF